MEYGAKEAGEVGSTDERDVAEDPGSITIGSRKTDAGTKLEDRSVKQSLYNSLVGLCFEGKYPPI